MLGLAMNTSGGIPSGPAAFFFSCFMTLTISMCLGWFSSVTRGCWVIFTSCSCSWAGVDKILPKCSCHLWTCSTAVNCLPSFPLTVEVALMKLFFASCLVMLYRSWGFLRSAAFCAAYAWFSAHILLSFLAVFLADLLASQYCLLRLVFSVSLSAFNNLPLISLRFTILPHVSSEIQSFLLIFLLPNISSLASRRAVQMLCHFFSVLSLAFPLPLMLRLYCLYSVARALFVEIGCTTTRWGWHLVKLALAPRTQY